MAVGDEADERQASERQVAALKVALAERDAQVAALSAQVARLSAQLEVLTELQNRNSKNSHLPPSSDGPGASGGAAGSRRPKSERKRGGQKGHRGSYRELLPAERVDTFVDLFPQVCLGCACRLPQHHRWPWRLGISKWSCAITGRT